MFAKGIRIAADRQSGLSSAQEARKRRGFRFEIRLRLAARRRRFQQPDGRSGVTVCSQDAGIGAAGVMPAPAVKRSSAPAAGFCAEGQSPNGVVNGEERLEITARTQSEMESRATGQLRARWTAGAGGRRHLQVRRVHGGIRTTPSSAGEASPQYSSCGLWKLHIRVSDPPGILINQGAPGGVRALPDRHSADR